MEPVVVQRQDGRKGTKLIQTDLSHADLSGAEIAYTAFHKALLDGLKHDGVLAAIKLRLEGVGAA
jgi:hypothetical protein